MENNTSVGTAEATGTATADGKPGTPTGTPTKPTMNFTAIPQDIKTLCSFCVWKKERRDGRVTKVPYDPRTGQMARTNAPDTFTDFNTAMKAYAMGGYAGIGIRVAEVVRMPSTVGAPETSDTSEPGLPYGIGAIDIDHCFRDDGNLTDVALDILKIFKDAYFERSPSGKGLRGFFKLSADFAYDKTAYFINNRNQGLEVYLPGTTNRFVTVTGNVYRPGCIPLDMEALMTLLNHFMKRSRPLRNIGIEPYSYLSDEKVILYAGRSKSAEKFNALYAGDWEDRYASHSEADMAFVSQLAFWCGCVAEQMDRIFRASGLMRDKWDRVTGDSTYGEITIRNAIASAQAVYTPRHISDDGALSEFDDLGALGDISEGNLDGDLEDEMYNPDIEGSGQLPDFTPDLSFVYLTLERMRPECRFRYGQGEIGIGNAFADYFKPIARYNRSRKMWFIYDGAAWRPDTENLAVSELAKRLVSKLYNYALQLKNPDARKQFLARVRPLQLRKNRKTMLDDARSVFPVVHKIFDQDPHLLNCQNGTLDLETFEFREHDPNDFLTMTAEVKYDPAATCPRWESFIDEVMEGNKELSKYLQKALGYALSADTSLECLFILYGPLSRNGKGTLMETFLRITGSYGLASNPELLGAKFGSVNASGPSEDVARLAGVRFVNIAEPDNRMVFNAALVKRMTGNDTLNARFLNENSFDFKPVFKIFINTNHLPNVTDMTLFDSGRLMTIPFTRRFEDDEQDHGLKLFFSREENLSGILNWCLDGYRELKAEGLKMPEAVRAATNEYREDSDRIGQFIEAWLEPWGSSEVRTAAVYRVYTSWCEKYGYFRENVKNFNNAMSQRFLIQKKRPQNGGSVTTMFTGVRFRTHENGEEVADGDFEALEEVSKATAGVSGVGSTGNHTSNHTGENVCPF